MSIYFKKCIFVVMAQVRTYENDILKTINKYKIYSIQDIFAFYSGCSRATFYNHGLEKLDSIKYAIENNKITTKHTLKSKWEKSDNATLQIALYKSICTDEERQHLSQSHVDHTTKGDALIKKTASDLFPSDDQIINSIED